ncbi:MFS transporter [Cohaesibacter celericrescens]|uniref:MFS transporter n=2 Tax=Cohaesibacter celericrescens TaxID=2067669 RepID=A0A2N5XTG5_9HYPH|nr:MFS transporter [Cohaesibacter celericrescens]
MFVLNGAYYGIWASRVPAIAQQHNLGEALLGVLLLCMCAGAIVSFPVTGRMVDKYGSAQVTKRIALLYGASLAALALVPNVWMLGLALVAFGAAHGAMDVSMNAWAGEVERHEGKPIMASFHAMWSFGAGLGAASGYLAVKLGAVPMTHFLTGAVICLALTLPFGLIRWVSPTVAPSSTKKKAPLLAIPKGALAFVGIIGFCSSMGEGGMGDWSAVFLVQVAQANEAIAALGFAAFSATMVIMRLIGDKIIARLGAVRAARISGVLAASGSLLAVAVANLPAILIGFALMGLGYALVFPLMFSRAANDDQLSPGAAIASVATLGYGGGLLGPVLIGFLAELLTIRLAFLVLSTLALAIVILAPYLAPVSENRHSDMPAKPE